MKKICIYIIVLLILFSNICFASEIVENTTVEVESEIKEPDINALNIYSDCILMIEKETGDILYERNGYEKMYPASTTKILSAILVLENCDLDEIATVSSTALKAVPATYTTSNIQVGEKLRVEDLLYTMLIPSANDAANVLAEHVAGSISGFADLMNEKAQEIGCKNSHFMNPSGVHDENHYTTAYDLSLIAKYAMNIEMFRKIVTTTTYTLPSTEAYPKEDRTFTLSNSLLNPNFKNYYYEYATGIKTGYTNPAKDCLVASAKKDDVEFIIVVLGDGYIDGVLREKYIDCKTLFDFAFDNYTAYYKNLQEENERKLQELTTVEASAPVSNESDSGFLLGLAKVLAITVIVFALLFIVRKFTKKKKKKNHYKFGGRKKPKHRK